MRCVQHENRNSIPGIEEEPDEGKQHRQDEFIIPAGFLIGLGVGLLADLVIPGILIGVGLGFIGSGLIRFVKRPQVGEEPQQRDKNVTNFLIGSFLIFIGMGIVLAPAAIWPYAIAGFLILTGIWFLVREFHAFS